MKLPCHLLNVQGVNDARLEILTEVLLKNQAFRDATWLLAPYSPNNTVLHPRRLESSGVNDSRNNEITSCFCHHENINVQWKVISIYSGGEEGLYVIKM
jgi:hypothetical protein